MPTHQLMQILRINLPELVYDIPVMGFKLRFKRKGMPGFPVTPIQTQRTLKSFYNGASTVSLFITGHLPGTGTLTPLLSPGAVSCPK